MSRVLVVDDDRAQRFLLVRWLLDIGLQVEEASNGEEALKAFDEAPPDIVLLDAMMPVLDGFETARALRKKAQSDRLLQILMVTALEDEESFVRGLEAGADDFVSKPLSRTLLRARIRSFARSRELFDAAQTHARTLEQLAEEDRAQQQMAAKLMDNLLSSPLLGHPALQLRSTAMESFNGDLVMAAPLGPRAFRILVGDFAGHGIEAAIGALPVAMEFEQGCRRGDTMTAFLDAAHGRLRSVVPSYKFLALATVDVDLERGRAYWVNAGMPSLLHLSDGEVTALPSTHPPLGVMPPPILREPPPSISLRRQDLLYIQTDGLMETENEAGEQFGWGRIQQSLLECEGELSQVISAVGAFRGDAPTRDDASLLRLRFEPEMAWGSCAGN
ncbi:MAG: fused response regulator/phosphatase [Myxococcota bacterium]